MIVMVDGSSEQVGAIAVEEGSVCDMCGRAWTGAVVAENIEDDRVAVLQYLHPDFEKVTEQQIRDFASEHACSQCGDPTDELPLWMAERVLRANPHLAMAENFDAICERCAKNYFADDSDGADGAEDFDSDADQH